MTWKHTTGLADSDEQRAATIKALLQERYYAAVKGDQDTLDQIEKELRRLGHEAARPEERAEKRPASRRTEKR